MASTNQRAGQTLLTATSHPTLCNFVQEDIRHFLRAWEHYTLRPQDSNISRAHPTPTSEISSINPGLFPSTVEMEYFHDVTKVSEFADITLLRWLESHG